jgi:hypothetical protein
VFLKGGSQGDTPKPVGVSPIEKGRLAEMLPAFFINNHIPF